MNQVKQTGLKVFANTANSEGGEPSQDSDQEVPMEPRRLSHSTSRTKGSTNSNIQIQITMHLDLLKASLASKLAGCLHQEKRDGRVSSFQ